MDISQHIQYWSSGAREDWEVAEHLVNSGKFRHGLFFAHLALEKVLKGHYCRVRQETPPFIHNLARLAQPTLLPMTPEQMAILNKMTVFNLAGRYPDEKLLPPFNREETMRTFSQAREVFQWLMNNLAPSSGSI